MKSVYLHPKSSVIDKVSYKACLNLLFSYAVAPPFFSSYSSLVVRFLSVYGRAF